MSGTARCTQTSGNLTSVPPLRILGGSISDCQVKRENRIEFTGLKGREDSPTRLGHAHFSPSGCDLVIARNEMADSGAIECSHVSQVEYDRSFAPTEKILNKNLDCRISRRYGHLAGQTNDSHPFTNVVIADRHAVLALS
jgi:hypothetical protein